MAERMRGLAEVRRRVKARFGKKYALFNLFSFERKCPLFDFFIIYQRDVDFRSFVFFKTRSDVDLCIADGTVDAIKKFVLEELERVGRGRKDELLVDFEIDSDENVIENFEGDYYLRLR